MPTLTISPELATLCPAVSLGVLRYTADVLPRSNELDKRISETVTDIQHPHGL